MEGEIYEVDQEALSALDILEGHPSWYARTPCQIIMTAESANKIEVTCHLYFLTNYKKELLALPFLNSFTKKHCSEYVTPASRKYGVNIKEQSQDVQQ